MKYLLLIILFSFAAFGECVTDTSFHCVKYINNYDGDTVKFDIKGVHPLIGKKINVRIKGIDTPEIKTKDKCEKDKGRNARRLVKNLLKNAKKIELKNIERDKYFRILSDVYYDGKLLSDILLKNKLAYRYNGGRKSIQDWCRH